MRLLAPFALMVLALAVVVWMDDTPLEADLVFVNQNEIFTLDPQRMSYLQDLRLAHVLYEGLVRWNNEEFSILPAVAVALPAVADEGTRYTFRLRHEALWSNGDPVTAHDFIYSWQRAILPDTAADYSNMFFVIEGAAAFFEWRVDLTAGFTADPWSAPGETRADAVTALADRMEALLADRPDGVARPEDGQDAAVAAELARLRPAAASDGAGLAVDLLEATATRAWRERLDDSASRAAEARWMWDRTEARFRATVGLRALDDRTLEVRLERPTAYFLDLLCFGVFFPVHRPTVEGWPASHPIPARGWHAVDPPPFSARTWLHLDPKTAKVVQRHEWAKPDHHVGNGTHRLAKWRYKRDVRLERNPRYHDPARVRAGSILARTIENTNTAVLAFESGHVDWLADVSAEYQADMVKEYRRYRTRYGDEIARMMSEGSSFDEALAALPPPGPGERRNVRYFPTFGTEFFSFNCRPELSDGRPNPFALAAVRRAFVMSVDKRTIVERVTRLEEPILRTLIPPGSIEGYRSPEGLPHDPDAARRELAAAGWEDRNGDGMVEDADGQLFPVVDLLYTTNVPRYKWISLELKAQWERELGVGIELRPSETKFYREDLKQGKFMIARGRWYGDYGDPTTFLDLCHSEDGNNDRGYESPQVDKWLEQAAHERDPEARMRILEKCERYLFDEEVPILVLCQLVQVYMYEPGRVTGLSEHPRLTQFLWQMEVVDR